MSLKDWVDETILKLMKQRADDLNNDLRVEFRKFSEQCDHMVMKEMGYGREKTDIPNCTHKEHLTVKYAGHMDYVTCSVNDCPLLK